MTQQDIIIIVATLTFATTFGVYVIIRKTIQYTRAPVNILVRQTGDIEMVDYIEPSQPVNAYYPVDLSNQQFINYDRVHSYWSGNPPSYHTTDGFFINSPLENNLDFILLLIFLSILIAFIIFKNLKSNVLIVTLFIFSFNLGLLMNSYIMSLLIPFSFFEIDFRDSFEWKFNSYGNKPKISYHKLQALTNDIELLLLSMSIDVNYSMGLSFIPSYKEWQENKHNIHPIFIDDPIIVNKESDPVLITQFIMERLNEKGLFITDWLFKEDIINKIDPVILTVTVPITVEI